MAEQFGEKRHEATPHRRQQAREQGQLARSHDLTSALMLLGAVGIFRFSGPSLVGGLEALTRRQLEDPLPLVADGSSLTAVSLGLMTHLGDLLLPVLGLVFLLALVTNVGQIGLVFLPSKLAFDFSRLDPLKGLQRVFSFPNTIRLGFGMFKVLVVTAVAGMALWSERTKVLELSTLSMVELAAYLIDLLLDTCLRVGVALLVLAILDYGYQRWKHEQDLRMTTQEMREELKEMQGDPQIAARRRAVQRQLVMNRINSAVPTADVVVTNPTELAIAIQYDHQRMEAPVVVAKGAGVLAQRIRRLALENGVPIVERKELARALYKQVEVGRPIPPEQYAAMAEVLKYVYQLQGRMPPGLEPGIKGLKV